MPAVPVQPLTYSGWYRFFIAPASNPGKRLSRWRTETCRPGGPTAARAAGPGHSRRRLRITLPMLEPFAFAQRHFMEGMATKGRKG